MNKAIVTVKRNLEPQLVVPRTPMASQLFLEWLAQFMTYDTISYPEIKQKGDAFEITLTGGVSNDVYNSAATYINDNIPVESEITIDEAIRGMQNAVRTLNAVKVAIHRKRNLPEESEFRWSHVQSSLYKVYLDEVASLTHEDLRMRNFGWMSLWTLNEVLVRHGYKPIVVPSDFFMGFKKSYERWIKMYPDSRIMMEVKKPIDVIMKERGDVR